MSLLFPKSTLDEINSLVKRLPQAEQKRMLSFLKIYTLIVDNPGVEFDDKNSSYNYLSNENVSSNDFQSLYKFFRLLFQFTPEERNMLINDFKDTAVILGLKKIENKPNKKAYTDAEALQIALETIEETRNEDKKDQKVCVRY